jgi:hypothetical protein
MISRRDRFASDGFTADIRLTILAGASAWLLSVALMGCGQTQGPGGTQTAQDPNAAIAAAARQNQQAALPSPDITLASSDNEMASAEVPVNPRNKVQRVGAEPNRFLVEVAAIQNVHASQKTETLCWAACTQMVLAQQGIRADQNALGQEFSGDQEDQSANVGVIMRAMNPDLESRLAHLITVPVQLFGITSDQMIRQLFNGDLVVVGLVADPNFPMGHACIVYGAEFAKLKPHFMENLFKINNQPGGQAASPDRYGLISVELFDPEPDVGPRTLTGAEFARQVSFITSRQIARDCILQSLSGKPVKSSGKNNGYTLTLKGVQKNK